MASFVISRRRLLSAGVVVGSSAALVPAEAKSIKGEMPWAPGVANAPEAVSRGGYTFFSSDEASFVEAAVARLIPSDDLGPGAKEAGVPIFIDRQLAGRFGSAEGWYMSGPWSDGTKSQGYQTRLAPAQLYRAAIKAIDDHCRQAFSGKRFSELSPDQQDQVIAGLEKGEIKLAAADAVTFFDVLLQNTVEGFF